MTRPTTSLEQRLSRAGLVIMLVSAALLWLLGRHVMDDALRDYVGSRLEHDAETILSAVNPGSATPPAIDGAGVSGIYHQPLSGHYFVIAYGAEGLIRSRSLWDMTLPPGQLAVGDSRLDTLRLADGTNLLVYTAGYRKSGRVLTIRVAEDIGEAHAAQRRFDLAFGIAAALGMLLLAWGLRHQVRVALSPLNRARDELDALEKGEIRQLSTRVPGEIRPLIDQVNRLLEALNARLARSRQSMGDLAHALKTPLTLLDQDIEKVGDTQTRAALRERSDRIARLIDRGLRRARLAGSAGAGELFRADQDIPELIELLRRLHPEIDWQTRLPTTGARLQLDREDMLELLGNLLDNAGKWARRQVLIELRTGGTLEILIDDDGPGIPETERTNILTRGSRLDESTSGHGLGTAIALDVVRQYHGRMELGESPRLGGLFVHIVLPLTRNGGQAAV